MKRLINALLRSLGYELVRPGASRAVRDPIVAAAIRTLRGHTMLPDHRLASLWAQVQHLESDGVAGSFVECGVWRGGASGMVALSSLACGDAHRELHLFDTFEGIPEPDADVDGDRAVSEARAQGVATTGQLIANPQFYTNQGRSPGSESDARHLLTGPVGYPDALIHVHRGFFQETVREAATTIGPVALLHLDADWYSSTQVCLAHLYDLVVQGGLISIDDYGAYEGCRRAVDEFLDARGISIYLHPTDAEAVTFAKP